MRKKAMWLQHAIFASTILMSTIINIGCAHNSAETKQIQQNQTSFLAFGDSGYFSTEPNGSGLMPIAMAMETLCEEEICNFAVMAGDNIYPKGLSGLAGSNSDQDLIQKAFITPFAGLSKNGSGFRIYVTLGNHDWGTSRKGAIAQVDFMSNNQPFYMDGLFYSVLPPEAKGNVEIFVVDTTMLLSPIQIEELDIGEDGAPFGTGTYESAGKEAAMPLTDGERNQLLWLEDAMSKSKAKWKLVLAHHPLWESNGSKADQSIVIREKLSPIVCKYADVYIAGHQHTLEVHEDSCEAENRRADRSPMLHVVTGAAGKSRAVNEKFVTWQNQQYPQLNNKWALGSVWGFTHISITGDELQLKMYAIELGMTAADAKEVYRTRYTKG